MISTREFPFALETGGEPLDKFVNQYFGRSRLRLQAPNGPSTQKKDRRLHGAGRVTNPRTDNYFRVVPESFAVGRARHALPGLCGMGGSPMSRSSDTREPPMPSRACHPQRPWQSI